MGRKGLAAAIMMVLSIAFGSCSKPTTSDNGTRESTEPVPLFEDLGSHHHAVTTSNETAQKYFDQGLRLIYGFNHDEAERAFREAVFGRSQGGSQNTRSRLQQCNEGTRSMATYG